jgi:hypothetical protein
MEDEMIVARMFRTASVACLLLAAGMAVAGPAEAQPAGTSNASLVSPATFEVEYGPYASENQCNLNRITVSQNWPPPISVYRCFVLDGYGWVFVATYDV